MDSIKTIILRLTLCMVCMLGLTACKVSYTPNGASINYDKVKTISFDNFPNRSSAFVWGPMESMFNSALRDKYLQQTKLRQVRQGGDLELSGEIINYDAINKGVGAQGYSTMAELRMTVNVRFTNNSNHNDDFKDRQFTASREYDASASLASVQEGLVDQMIKDLVDQIFNATLANW